jgi:hypothetical protein
MDLLQGLPLFAILILRLYFFLSLRLFLGKFLVIIIDTIGSFFLTIGFILPLAAVWQ